jgi:hypothetical protein
MLWFNEMYLDVNLTRSGLVMVNLDYQLDWIEKCIGGEAKLEKAGNWGCVLQGIFCPPDLPSVYHEVANLCHMIPTLWCSILPWYQNQQILTIDWTVGNCQNITPFSLLLCILSQWWKTWVIIFQISILLLS